jgi:hypothetical protein
VTAVSLDTRSRSATRAIGVALAVLTLAVAWFIRLHAAPAPAHYFAVDQPIYLAIAEHPLTPTSTSRQAAHSWRVLPPLAAKLAGIVTARPPEFGFLLVTFGAFAVLPFATLRWLDALGVSNGSAVTGAAAVALSPAVVGMLAWDVIRVDACSVLLVTLSAVATVRCRPWLLVASLLALSLTKETVLVAAVFALAWALCVDRRVWRPALVGSALACMTRGILLPWLMPPWHAEFDSLAGLRGTIDALSVRYVGRRVLLATASTWNVLVPLAAVALAARRWTGREVALAAGLAAGLGQMVFASDTQRLVAAAYPFVVALAASQLDRLPRRWHVPLFIVVVGAQVPWLLVYGRVLEIPALRAIEIGVFTASAVLAMYTAVRAWKARVPAITGESRPRCDAG